MPKPKLSLDTVRLHPAPIYRDGKLTGFTLEGLGEVKGTLYLPAGGTMKLWQPLTPQEQAELEALLARVSVRILSAMTAALTPEEGQDPD